MPEPYVLEDPERTQMIEKIWDKVEPFPIASLMDEEAEPVTESSSARIQGTEPKSTSLEHNLAQYPAWKRALGINSKLYEIYLYHLQDRIEKLGNPHTRLDTVAYLWSYLGKPRPDERLGSLLNGCYRKKRFRQPKSLDGTVDLKVLFHQSRQVIEYSILLNDVYRLWDFDSQSTWMNWDVWLEFVIQRVFASSASIENILGLPMSKLILILHLTTREVHLVDGAKGNTLRIDDLDILSLTSIGKLSIKWTEFLADHLHLNLRDMTLSVKDDLLPIWSSPLKDWHDLYVIRPPKRIQLILYLLGLSLLEDMPSTLMQSIDLSGRSGECNLIDEWQANIECVQSWAILFAKGKGTKRDSAMLEKHAKWSDMPNAHQNYLREMHQGKSRSWTSSYQRIVTASSSKDPVSYELFPIYEARLRELRHYMDNQKPRGLRQLWKDNRDSLNYYTFWGVIIFGVLSVVLAMFSLAVSVAQTVAAFRSLEGPSAG